MACHRPTRMASFRCQRLVSRRAGTRAIIRLVDGGYVHLNGWQRIGIVLSVVWVIVGGLWGNQFGRDELRAAVVAAHRRCLDERSVQPDGTIPKDTNWGPCNQALSQDYPVAVQGQWWYAVAFAFIPIPIAWLTVYGFLALVGWIKVDFTMGE